MKEKSLKTKIENLCSIKKHRYKILQDHKTQKFYHYTSLIMFILAIFLMIILYYKNFPYQSGIFVFISVFIGAFLYFQSLICPICDKSRWVEHLEQVVLGYVHILFFFRDLGVKMDLLEYKRFYCENCNLTHKQMNRYIDMLKRDVEITENTVQHIFMGK